MVKYALYPGCLVSNRYPNLELAVRKIAESLDVHLEDMQGTSCCPEPQGIQSTDKRTWMTLAARNIVIAEEMGKDILTLCNGCFETLKSVNVRLKRHPELKTIGTMVNDTGQRYLSTELCGEIKEVEIPEREHPLDEHTIRELDRYQATWEIIE